jgi:hypothetical protein
MARISQANLQVPVASAVEHATVTQDAKHSRTLMAFVASNLAAQTHVPWLAESLE